MDLIKHMLTEDGGGGGSGKLLSLDDGEATEERDEDTRESDGCTEEHQLNKFGEKGNGKGKGSKGGC